MFVCFGGFLLQCPSPTRTVSVFWVLIGSKLEGSLAVEAQWLAHCAIASSEEASKNCLFLTHKWHFMHSSLFCGICEEIFHLWTDRWRDTPTPYQSSRLIGEPCPVTSEITANEHLVATMGGSSLVGWTQPHSAAVTGWSSLVCCDLLALSSPGDWLSRKT